MLGLPSLSELPGREFEPHYCFHCPQNDWQNQEVAKIGQLVQSLPLLWVLPVPGCNLVDTQKLATELVQDPRSLYKGDYSRQTVKALEIRLSVEPLKAFWKAHSRKPKALTITTLSPPCRQPPPVSAPAPVPASAPALPGSALAATASEAQSALEYGSLLVQTPAARIQYS